MLLLRYSTLLERCDNMKNKPFLCIFVLFLFFFAFPHKVYAADTFVLPEEPYIYGFATGVTAEDIAADIYNNASLKSLGYTASNSYFFVNYNSYSGNCTVYVVFPSDFVYSAKARQYYNGSYVEMPFLLFSSCATAYGNINNIENLSFTIVNSTQSGNKTSYGVADTTSLPNQASHYFVDSFFYSSGFYMSDLEYSRSFCLGTYILPPFNPDSGFYRYYYNGVQLVFNPDDFYTWILDNNKLVELPSYIVESKLLSFLNFYKDYGSSATSFFHYVPQWFTYMSISGQTNDNINILKSSIDKLYREYQTYLNNNHAYWPGAVKLEKRNNIDTKTDNDNLTLVTDKQTDDDITLILRDILRGIIAIPNQLYSVGQDIKNSINQLDFTVNIANDGGVSPSPSSDTDIIYTDQGDFGIDEIHQYEPLPEAPDIDGEVDFLDYPAVLAQSTNAFFNLLPSEMSALMSAVLVLGVLITKIGR